MENGFFSSPLHRQSIAAGGGESKAPQHARHTIVHVHTNVHVYLGSEDISIFLYSSGQTQSAPPNPQSSIQDSTIPPKKTTLSLSRSLARAAYVSLFHFAAAAAAAGPLVLSLRCFLRSSLSSPSYFFLCMASPRLTPPCARGDCLYRTRITYSLSTFKPNKRWIQYVYFFSFFPLVMER